MTLSSLQENLIPCSLLWLLENIYASALFFCLCFPTLNNKVKNILMQNYSVLPLDIISCQLSLLLCLFLAWSNIILVLCWKKKKKKAQLLSSRKIESARRSAHVHKHVEISRQLLCLLFYPWSYQQYFPLKQTQCFEVMSSLSPWKPSRQDNRQKGIHFISEGVKILMCHNFCCQIKHRDHCKYVCKRHRSHIFPLLLWRISLPLAV